MHTLARTLDKIYNRHQAGFIEEMTKHGMDMAKYYKLGSPESRAIVSTLQHIRSMMQNA